MKNSFGARGGIRKCEGNDTQTWGGLEVAGTSKTRKGHVTWSRDANRPIRRNADAKKIDAKSQRGSRYLGLQKGATPGIPRVRTPIGLNAETQTQKIDARSQRGS